ncbi:MAG: hypothetical protein OEZ65_15715 [Gemmatimonadota bacterium]|nr:hypothetical protein [Gemmatimonadota bacterium]
MTRPSLWPAVAVTLCVTLLSCEPDIELSAPENPLPLLFSVAPAVMVTTSGTPVLEVRGQDFIGGAQAHWNGADRPTDVDSDSILTVTLLAGDAAAAGSHRISVTNPGPGGGTSGEFEVTVVHDAAVMDSISPRQALATSSSGFTLDVFGSNFVAEGGGATVFWGQLPLVTEVLSGTHLRAVVPDFLLQLGAVIDVAVENPEPSAGLSGPVSFRLENPVPTTTGTDPDSITLDSTDPISVIGTGFVQGAVVWYNGRVYTPRLLSATSVTVDIPREERVRSSGIIQVENPGPGGGRSDTLEVTIRELTPHLRTVQPASVVAGSPTFAVTVGGWYFAPDATVLWNGNPLPTTSLGDGTVRAQVDASLVADLGSALVSVENPRGGGRSSARDFGITPPGRVVWDRYSDSWSLPKVLISEFDGSIVDSLLTQFRNSPLDVTVGGSILYSGPICHGMWPATWCESRAYSLTRTTEYRRVTAFDSTSVVFGEGWPRASADESWIYFSAAIQIPDSVCGSLPCTKPELWRVRPDGSGAELVHPAPSANAEPRYPAPSSGGTKVAYSAYRYYQPTTDALEILDLQTGVVTPLGVSGHEALWAPDDSWIAYRTPWGGSLHLIRPDGTGDRSLTAGIVGTVERGFDWSPDGRFIVLTTTDNSGEFDPTTENPRRAWLVIVDTGQVIPLSGLVGATTIAWYGGP